MGTVTDDQADLPPLARNVLSLRKERGWTLQKTEKESGVSFQLIGMIEKGTRDNPTLQNLQGLATAFDITIDDLVAADTPTPAPLQELIDSGLISDVTLRELRQLRLAKGLLGREPDRADYFALVELIRRKRERATP